MSSRRSSRKELHLSGSLGLELLSNAFATAQDVSRDPWQFAVEIGELQRVGMTHTDLRWLLTQGLVELANEVTGPKDTERRFRKVKTLSLNETACFLLTKAGLSFVAKPKTSANKPKSKRRGVKPVGSDRAIATAAETPEGGVIVPTWDAKHRELWFGSEVIKRFTHSAPVQELILTTFQEEGWPEMIDDPIPPQNGLNPRRHLYQTLQNLNRAQHPQRLRFAISSDGRAVRWRAIPKR